MAEPLRLPGDGDTSSVHVPDPQPNHTLLRWDPVRSSGERIRVVAYTSDCQPTFYELCQAGGLFFIRRTRRTGGRVLIHESARIRRALVIPLWEGLLEGMDPVKHSPA
ncbi:hypothetical protein [Nonomuraea sp. SYSU D8015]|uniref:hypothetical protein n=1 Tax=Nonomuraea sp. SYSU D8015 TaxID=2593644 RepID=UPI0016611162|nr:hypothetical protein [Nonomuraea sp. SYSU D8015]